MVAVMAWSEGQGAVLVWEELRGLGVTARWRRTRGSWALVGEGGWLGRRRKKEEGGVVAERKKEKKKKEREEEWTRPKRKKRKK